MSDPTVVLLTAGTWVKVATSVTQGMIWVLKTRATYVQTYRNTGGAAPADLNDAAPLPEPGLPISSDDLIDVYVRAEGFDGACWVGV